MKQIIAIGGWGLSMPPESALLDQYILQQAKSSKPKICYLPTASGDSEANIQSFYNAYNQYECVPTHLSLFKPSTTDLEDFLLDKDIIYVGGGSTRNMLVLWKEWKLDVYLKKAWENQTVLSGVSAGANIWFEEALTNSTGQVTKIECLGLLSGSFCPHYHGEPDRRPAFHRLLHANQIKKGRGVDDGVALHFKDNELIRAVSSHPDVKAFDLELAEGRVMESALAMVYLGD